MIDVGIGHDELKNLIKLMVQPHTLYIRVRLLDLDHNYIDDLSLNFVEGVVTVDATADVTRSLDMKLFDPFQQIHLDPDSPSKTSIYVTNMIQVIVVIQKPDRSKTYTIPVFTGPIDDVSRDDIFISIKCLGKETLSLAGLWRGKTYKKNQEKTYVIKNVLRTLLGEIKMSIRDLAAKIPNDMTFNRKVKPFLKLKGLAKTMGFQLFYDGRGVAVLRKLPKGTVHTFDDTWLCSVPEIDYDLSKTINAAEVTGKKPKKGKKTPKARYVAQRSHPLSPWRLGRGNPIVPRYLWAEVQDDSLTSNAECKKRAKEIVQDGLLAGIEVKAEGVPMFLLQEMDPVRFHNENVSAHTRARQFTLPLVAGNKSSYGYIQRSKPRGGASQHQRKRSHK